MDGPTEQRALPRVLLVDDEAISRQVVSRLLRKFNFEGEPSARDFLLHLVYTRWACG